MSNANSKDERAERIERIQEIVREDFDRIQDTSDPFIVLNLDPNSSREEVRDRYERYERFYRAENFQRLGNMDLTRKALDVRRAIGRSMVEIQSLFEKQEAENMIPAAGEHPDLPDVDPDAAAMGDIYFRDGLTYLRLGDFNAACRYFERACDYDPSRGVFLANLAYTQFKLDPTNESVVEETEPKLSQAAKMEPDNAEIFALLARFRINTSNQSGAHEALDRLEALDPNHPLLESLKKRANY